MLRNQTEMLATQAISFSIEKVLSLETETSRKESFYLSWTVKKRTVFLVFQLFRQQEQQQINKSKNRLDKGYLE